MMEKKRETPALFAVSTGTDSPTKQTITYHLLKEALIHHDFKPGSTLTERKLCSYFAVSRPPVHNAVLQLASEGMLKLDPRHGIIVPEVNLDELTEIFEMLETLQMTAVSSHRFVFSREDCDDFKSSIRRMTDVSEDLTADHYLCFTQDQSFHARIVAASENRRLRSSFEIYSNQYAAYSAILFSTRNRGNLVHEMHTPIIEAILNQSVTDFKKHLHNHYLCTLDQFSQLCRA